MGYVPGTMWTLWSRPNAGGSWDLDAEGDKEAIDDLLAEAHVNVSSREYLVLEPGESPVIIKKLEG